MEDDDLLRPHFREFLETYQIYKKLKKRVPFNLAKHYPPPITELCRACRSTTFTIREYKGSVEHGYAVALYACAGCKGGLKVFLLEFGKAEEAEEAEGKLGPVDVYMAPWIMKAGEHPRWESKISKQLEAALGDHTGLYKSGVACEAESFGIAAFAYYRRIVEQLIQGFVDSKRKKLPSAEHHAFDESVAQAWRNSAKEVLEIVSEQIPAAARPEGTNPLAILYGRLSDGLHSKSDEDCMADVEDLRRLLEGFVERLKQEREEKDFAVLVRKASKP